MQRPQLEAGVFFRLIKWHTGQIYLPFLSLNGRHTLSLRTKTITSSEIVSIYDRPQIINNSSCNHLANMQSRSQVGLERDGLVPYPVLRDTIDYLGNAVIRMREFGSGNVLLTRVAFVFQQDPYPSFRQGYFWSIQIRYVEFECLYVQLPYGEDGGATYSQSTWQGTEAHPHCSLSPHSSWSQCRPSLILTRFTSVRTKQGSCTFDVSSVQLKS